MEELKKMWGKAVLTSASRKVSEGVACFNRERESLMELKWGCEQTGELDIFHWGWRSPGDGLKFSAKDTTGVVWMVRRKRGPER